MYTSKSRVFPNPTILNNGLIIKDKIISYPSSIIVPKNLIHDGERISLAPWEKWFIYLARVSSAVGSIPLSKVESDGYLHVSRSRITMWVWYCRIMCLTLDNLYLFSVSKDVDSKVVGNKEYMDFWMHTGSRTIASFVLWAMALNVESTMQLFNTLRSTRIIWKESWGTDFRGPLEKNLRRPYRCAVVLACLHAVGPLALHLENRQSVRYWGSKFLPNRVYNSKLGIVAFAAYDMLNSLISVNAIGYCALVIVPYFVIMKFWMMAITAGMNQIGNSACSIPLKQYRYLICVQSVANSGICEFIFPVLTSLAFFILCMFFSLLIKFGDQLSTPILIIIFGMSPLVIAAFYFVYRGGSEILETGNHIKRMLKLERNLYRRKQLASLRDMRMYVGQFYYITRDAFIANMQWVVDHTIDIVLAF